MQKIVLIFVLIIATAQVMMADEIEFSASAPSSVSAGQRFRVTFQLNTRPTDFAAPDFEGFRVLSGPSQSSSSSMQIINGQTTRTESFSYSFVLEAVQEGTFTIGHATATIGGTQHNSNEVRVRVGAATASPPAGSQQQQQRPAAETSEVSERDIFIRARANNTNPWQGQQVIVTYNLYTRVNVNQYSTDRLPSYRGFWSENITAAGQPQTRTEVIDGYTYRVAEIRRVALFAQRSGEVTIDPLEVEAVISIPDQQRRQSLFDDFFGGSPFSQRTARQKIKSNALTINVKPLPVQNRPAAFSGMVGTDFRVSADLTPRELAPNDAANMHITIAGNGNLRMLEKPSINFPANLEVFDPNITDNIRNTTSGITGSRRYEYILIPRTAGEFNVPPFNFVYFDTDTEEYVNLQSTEFTVQVSGDPSQAGNDMDLATREDVRLLATDIRHIRTGNYPFLPAGSYFYGSKLFLLLILLPLVIFIIFLVHQREQIKLNANQQLLRNRKAQKLARKRLKLAKKFLDKNDEDQFYDEIFKTLWGYLSDKLSIPVSILNKETVSGAFKAQKVSTEISDTFMETLSECEFARFAPGEKQVKMADIYHKAFNTILTIEKELRSKKV